MFKLVVLSVVLAAAAANASVLGLGSLGYNGLGVSPLGLGGLGYASSLAHGGLGYASPLGLGGLGYASPLGLGGLGYASPLGLGGLGYASPLGHGGIGLTGQVAPAPAPIAAAPLGLAPNYRGPVSLAPGQPANIIAADGRPLDTLSVNVDRAQHLLHRAVDSSAHLLKKRSLVTPVVAPVATSWSSRVDVPAVGLPLAGYGVGAAPLAYGGIVGPVGAIAPLGLGAHGRIW